MRPALSDTFDFEVAGNSGDDYSFGADDSVVVNDYMQKVLQRSKDASDVSLWDEAVSDAALATSFGVENDEDFKIFHYIDVFVEDIADEVFGDKLSESEEDELKKFLFNLRSEIDYSDLSAFWVGVVKWLKNRKKVAVAYPNRGDNGSRYVQKNNLAAWAKLAQYVRKQVLHGAREDTAVRNAALMLNPLERLDFKAWYRFKYGKSNRMYNLNEEIMEKSEGSMSLQRNANSKFAYMHEDNGRYYLPDFSSPYHDMASNEPATPEETPEDLIEKEKQRERFNEARSKLVSRTFAIDKLLERFHTILDDEAVSDIEDAVNSLRKKIRQLKSATIIRDTVIKTAKIVGRKGFTAGSDYLVLSVNEFMGDKFKIEKKAMEGFNLKDVTEMLQKLQEVSNQLKRRDIVRDIARIDFKLHEMNASALFPELSEAQAKLIEATTYASNKLEDVIPKLRTINNKPAPGAAGPAGPGEPPMPDAAPAKEMPDLGPPGPVEPAAPAVPPTSTPSPAAPKPPPEQPSEFSELEKAI